MRMFKVTREDYPGQSWVSRDLATVQDAEFDGADIGDSITVTLVEVTQEQLDKSPEFEGW
jgi:hypothetical protein